MTMNKATATEQTILADLVALWLRRRAEGQTVTPSELCRERPELLPQLEQRIDDLERKADRSGAPNGTTTLDYLGSPQVAAIPARWPAIPGYEVLSELGRGGMGVVYKARQTQLDRLTALKMILSGVHADEGELARFRTEAETIARLQHANIVQIHEVGEHDGRPFFSLEFCAGGSLEHKINRTPLPAAEAARLVETLAQAMQAAHQSHVIHRDLKPGNVLLTADGTPKITDFGLAKKLDVQGQTHTGAVMGTPSYMAPEQASGQKDVGPAVDVYALGAILYELLTGRPPFKGASIWDTVQMVIGTEPVAPRQLQPKVPRDLETICLKCLQKQPSRRYASAAALADDLNRFRAGEPIAARPVGRLERGWRWCRRNPMTAGLSAVLLLLLIAVAGGSTVAAIHLNRKENEARNNAEIAKAQREQARFSQYVAEMNLVQREYETNNLDHVRELLDAQVPQEADVTDFRNFEWYYWQRMGNRELLTLKGRTNVIRRRLNAVAAILWSENKVTAMSFRTDGRRLAYASNDETVRVWDAETGKELLKIEGHASSVYGVCFSPDGSRLASAGQDQTVRVWDASTGKKLLTLKGHTGSVYGVSFNSDGRWLATAGEDQTLRVWDASTGLQLAAHQMNRDNKANRQKSRPHMTFSPDGRRLAAQDHDAVRVWDTATGKELSNLKDHTGPVDGMSFGPDGKRLATVRGGTVHVWDTDTGKVLLAFKGSSVKNKESSVNGVSFSRDGRRLATIRGEGAVCVWDAETGQELLTLRPRGPVSSPVYGVSFSPDGRRLASAGRFGTVRVWDVVTETFTLKQTNNLHSLSYNLTYSPDGRWLATAGGDGTVCVRDADTGQELRTLRHRRPVYGVSFSPDGRRLASAGGDQTVRVWDAETGRELLTLKGHTGPVRTVSFSPDGSRLASGGQDETARVWDAATGQELLTLSLKGHTGPVMGVSFSPDGRRLVTLRGGTLHLQDADTGQGHIKLEGHQGQVFGVAYSPDGRRLASGGNDHTVRLWDTATGKELLTLKGHTGSVFSVSYSLDGRRLTSASEDKTVRVWDAVTGKELLNLKGRADAVRGVSFSPDGRRLASVGDKTVHIWEGVIVPVMVWRKRWLVSQVDSLFEKHLFRANVLVALRQDATLDEADRQFAIEVAQSHHEDAWSLNKAAWDVVKTRDAGADAYALALPQAEAAVQQFPDERFFLSTLLVAQYRAGRYADALATRTKSEKFKAAKEGSLPPDLAFLGLIQHQLGKKDQAKATLGRLREVMKQPRWAKDTEALAFLHEAQELIEGKPNDKVDPKNKPAPRK